MRVIICQSADEASSRAAQLIKDAVLAKPALVLGVATGSSPRGLYRELARYHRDEAVSFARTRIFGLDEYVGLRSDHPACYHVYVRDEISSPLGIPPAYVDVPRGDAADLRLECRRYEGAIKAAGGIDIQILGIGTDGHIGFNEPGSSLASRTRVWTLSEQTIHDNQRYFAAQSPVPNQVITMGIATILEARHIILLAFGETKRAIISRALEGPVTAMVPASSLQYHPNVTVLLDEEAASSLVLREYHLRAEGFATQ